MGYRHDRGLDPALIKRGFVSSRLQHMFPISTAMAGGTAARELIMRRSTCSLRTFEVQVGEFEMCSVNRRIASPLRHLQLELGSSLEVQSVFHRFIQKPELVCVQTRGLRGVPRKTRSYSGLRLGSAATYVLINQEWIGLQPMLVNDPDLFAISEASSVDHSGRRRLRDHACSRLPFGRRALCPAIISTSVMVRSSPMTMALSWLTSARPGAARWRRLVSS